MDALPADDPSHYSLSFNMMIVMSVVILKVHLGSPGGVRLGMFRWSRPPLPVSPRAVLNPSVSQVYARTRLYALESFRELEQNPGTLIFQKDLLESVR